MAARTRAGAPARTSCTVRVGQARQRTCRTAAACALCAYRTRRPPVCARARCNQSNQNNQIKSNQVNQIIDVILCARAQAHTQGKRAQESLSTAHRTHTRQGTNTHTHTHTHTHTRTPHAHTQTHTHAHTHTHTHTHTAGVRSVDIRNSAASTLVEQSSTSRMSRPTAAAGVRSAPES